MEELAAPVRAAGEDRSSFQQVSGWPQDFGMCKATEGLSWKDPSFAANWAGLKAAGIPRTAYHFFHPALDPVAQAVYFAAFVRAHGIGDGDAFAVDAELTVGAAGVEESGHIMTASRSHVPFLAVPVSGETCQHDPLPTPVFGATAWCDRCQQYCGGTGEDGTPVQCSGCAEARAAASSASVESKVIAFMDEAARQLGSRVIPLVYTYASMAQNSFTAALADRYSDLWIADYGVLMPATGPWKNWRYWQVQPGGAPGGGDADVYNGTRSELHDWVASHRTPPEPPPAPSPLPAFQKAVIARLPELHEGASDQGGHTEWVRQAQYLLNIVSADTDLIVADGDFGPETATLVLAVQAASGLAQDGIIGPATWQVLIAGGRSATLPEHVAMGAVDLAGQQTHWQVHRIQAYCNVHSAPTGIDGIYGQGTAGAVKAVQKAYGVPETGEVDEATWSLLIAHARP